jgi:uncharacterized protein YjiS (DUF1127 family)
MSVVNILVGARRAFGEWRRRRRAYAELMALDDRALADIGVYRSQIRALVAGTDRRQPACEPERFGPREWLALLAPRV